MINEYFTILIGISIWGAWAFLNGLGFSYVAKIKYFQQYDLSELALYLVLNGVISSVTALVGGIYVFFNLVINT